MCITFFRIGTATTDQTHSNDQFPFMLAFNRDEITYRRSEPAKFLEDQNMPNILCGIDIQTNSTWLAFNKLTGNLCFLTNFRTPSNYDKNRKKQYSSRGFLVMDFVKMGDPTIKEQPYKNEAEYEQNIMTIYTRGFNLVYGNVKTGVFKHYQHRNLDDGKQFMKEPVRLEQGIVYGMSNGSLLEAPDWDKVSRGKQHFTEIFNEATKKVADITPEEIPNYLEKDLAKTLITDLMKDNTRSRWALTQTGTGYPKIWEYQNSSIFIRNSLGDFCTVSTSVLLLQQSGDCYFEEQRYRHTRSKCVKLMSSLGCVAPRYDVGTTVRENFKFKY